MRKVTVYSMEVCTSCERVKNMLDAREIPYEEVVMSPDSPALDELAQRSGMTSLPQVYIGSILVGGGDQTMAAASSGMLDDLLVD
ncbi:MAG: glutaredoxin 3 [Solirubrobacteraceae bacterium]|jgi:glutaredoxin 3|nr:glutaredoxin 3 [Solirubrobacteraceae bacterium]